MSSRVINGTVTFIKHGPSLSVHAGIHTGQCKRTRGCYNELVVAF